MLIFIVRSDDISNVCLNMALGECLHRTVAATPTGRNRINRLPFLRIAPASSSLIAFVPPEPVAGKKCAGSIWRRCSVAADPLLPDRMTADDTRPLPGLVVAIRHQEQVRYIEHRCGDSWVN